MVLGGHDHHYDFEVLDNRLLLKSGTDFKDITRIEIVFIPTGITEEMEKEIRNKVKVASNILDVIINKEKNFILCFEHVEVTRAYPRDEEMKKHTIECLAKMNDEMGKPIGYSSAPLECRFAKIRASETNLGNWIADIINIENQTDFTIINSGTIRADSVLAAGTIKLKDIKSMMPYSDKIFTFKIKGEQIKRALENGVSCYPALEGRFPIISGI